MSKIDTYTQKFGNVVKFEDHIEKGWCRKILPITMAAGMDVGAVVELTTDPTRGTWVAAATAANAAAIVIDDRTPELTAGDQDVAVIYQGDAIVADNALIYDGAMSEANETSVATALAAIGIKVEKQI